MLPRCTLHVVLPVMLLSLAGVSHKSYCAPALDPQYRIVAQFKDANGPAVRLANGKVYRLGTISPRQQIPTPIAIDIGARLIGNINTAQPGSLPPWFLRRQKIIPPPRPKPKAHDATGVDAPSAQVSPLSSLLWVQDLRQHAANFRKAQNTSLPSMFEIPGLATRVRDQGGFRDACTFFAATLGVEAAYIRLKGIDVDLSEEYLNDVVEMQLIANGANPLPLPSAEIKVGLWGGGQIDTNFMVMRDAPAGIPEEAEDPYNDLGPTPAGNILDSSTNGDQQSVDDVTILDTSVVLNPPGTTLTPLPIAALVDATYRATAFDMAPDADLSNLDWYRQRLSNGEALVIQFDCCGNDNESSGLWEPGTLTPANATASHAAVLIGYDDGKQAFLMRNSWGENSSRLFSYKFATDGLIVKVISVTAVAPVVKGVGLPSNQAVVLGRWLLTDAAQPNRSTPTGTGFLDIYRYPSSNKGIGRIGTFFAEDGTQYRVNGQFVPDPGNANGRLDFYIDTSTPDAAFTSAAGTHYSATYMFENTPAGAFATNSHTMMVGKVLDGSQQQFVLHKAVALPTSVVKPLTGLRPDNKALIGWWEIYWEGEAGTLLLKSYDPQTQNFIGIYEPFGGSTWVDAVGAVNGNAVVLLTGVPSTHLGIGGFADVNHGVVSGHAPQLNVLNAFVAVLRSPTPIISFPAAGGALGPAAH